MYRFQYARQVQVARITADDAGIQYTRTGCTSANTHGCARGHPSANMHGCARGHVARLAQASAPCAVRYVRRATSRATRRALRASCYKSCATCAMLQAVLQAVRYVRHATSVLQAVRASCKPCVRRATSPATSRALRHRCGIIMAGHSLKCVGQRPKQPAVSCAVPLQRVHLTC